MNDTTREATNDNVTMIFYNTKDLALFMGCSIPTARKLFYRPDFPGLKIGKNWKVEKQALERWCSEKHT